MTELFSSTLNKENPKDIECSNKISLNLIKLNKRAINFIEKLNDYIKLFTEPINQAWNFFNYTQNPSKFASQLKFFLINFYL
jgi:hypothetical protein